MVGCVLPNTRFYDAPLANQDIGPDLHRVEGEPPVKQLAKKIGTTVREPFIR